MSPRAVLPAWEDLAGLDDADVPLLDTALLIARDEYPDIDPQRCTRLLEAHAADLRGTVERIAHPALKIQAISRHLFEEVGYAGDHDAYYDPRNSYLNQVVDRRLGNPISLAMVQMEVARRLGVPLDGVSFPGHFLVRLPVDDGLLVMDPFNRGRPLDVDELRERARPHMGGDAPDDALLARILHPASHRAILLRVLRNLHGIYRELGDWARAARSADRLLALAPGDPGGFRDRGLAYLALDYTRGAQADLTRYLALAPDADDAGEIRRRLPSAGSAPLRLH